MTETVKRIPGYPITINKNVEQVREKIQSVCENHKISASNLFGAIVDTLTDEQWEEFANIAKQRKNEQKKLNIDLKKLNPEQRSKLTQMMSELGIES